jgi:uncharacterized protein (DUF58 family)
MQESTDRTREILKKVRKVEIRSRRSVNDALSGAYKSVFKGTGVDFEEVREYVPGDDVRSIDWNVTARTDKPYIKRFREDRELAILILVDLSASGNFGSQSDSKRELMAELAAVLAFSATRNNDRVGLLLFTDTVERYIPPQKGRTHILRMIRELLFFEPSGKGTHLGKPLEMINRVLHRHAVVFLISDFLSAEVDFWEKDLDLLGNELIRLMKLTNRRHDLICVNVRDPREDSLPDVGWVTVEDSETGEIMEVNTGNESLRLRFESIAIQRQERFRNTLKKCGIDHFAITTAEPYITALQKFLRQRQKAS